jgi:hypothetical protein
MFIVVGWTGGFVHHRWSQIVGFSACGILAVWWIAVRTLTPFAVPDSSYEFAPEGFFRHLGQSWVTAVDMNGKLGRNDIAIYPFEADRLGLLVAEISKGEVRLQLATADGEIMQDATRGWDSANRILMNVPSGRFAIVVTGRRGEGSEYELQISGEAMRPVDPNAPFMSPSAVRTLRDQVAMRAQFNRGLDVQHVRIGNLEAEQSQIGSRVILEDLAGRIDGNEVAVYPFLTEESGTLVAETPSSGTNLFLIKADGLSHSGEEGGNWLVADVPPGESILIVASPENQRVQYALRVSGAGIRPVEPNERASPLSKARQRLHEMMEETDPELRVKERRLLLIDRGLSQAPPLSRRT